jgi:hypothetical protein
MSIKKWVLMALFLLAICIATYLGLVVVSGGSF